MKLPRLLIEAEDAEIAANQNTHIETFVANAPVIVSGEATIQNATINTGGVFFNLKPAGVLVAPGVPDPTYPVVIPIEEEVFIPSSLTELKPFGVSPQVGIPFNAGQISPIGASVTYQWWICAVDYGVFQEIENATSASYTPVAQDEGHVLQVSIRGYGDYQGYLISNPSEPVLPEDTSQSDNLALLEAKFFLEDEMGRVFLVKDYDFNIYAKTSNGCYFL